MVNIRIIERPAFEVIGKQTWIGGQDNDLFGRFWQESQSNGLLAALGQLSNGRPGAQTHGYTLGVSRVEKCPSKREFFYMIAIEKPENCTPELLEGMETSLVPAAQWAVFECHGEVPMSIVQAEMYAFMEWLPNSGYEHALAPEMEVYPGPENYCEFWLPIQKKPDR